MLKGGDDGPAIATGKPEASKLVKAIRYGQDFPQMPPTGKLPAGVVADFEKWIAAGIPIRDCRTRQRQIRKPSIGRFNRRAGFLLRR